MPTESPSLEQVPRVEGGAPVAQEGQAQPRQHDLVLWSNKTCPFVQSVLIALNEKGLEVHERQVDIFGERDAEFSSLFRSVCPDPRRRPAIPLLQHFCNNADSVSPSTGLVLIESAVIVQYLEEAFPASPGLLPADALSRARVRLFVDTFQKALGSSQAEVLGASTWDGLHAAAEKMQEGFRSLDAWFQSYSSGDAGPFVCGELFSLAEVMTAPHVQRLVTVVPHLRPKLPGGPPLASMEASLPCLSRWVKAVLARTSVARSFDADLVAGVQRRALARLPEAEGAGEQGDGVRRGEAASVLDGLLRQRLGQGLQR